MVERSRRARRRDDALVLALFAGSLALALLAHLLWL